MNWCKGKKGDKKKRGIKREEVQRGREVGGGGERKWQHIAVKKVGQKLIY